MSSGCSCCNKIQTKLNMASAEEILDEVLLSESDSESEQVVKPSVVHRTADLKEKREAQITICLEAFNKLDLGNNLGVFKANILRQIKCSFQAFKPPTDPLKILLNVSLNCGLLSKTVSELQYRSNVS